VTLPAWREEPVSQAHDRQRFDCGESELNGYFQGHARKNHESGGAKTFVATSDGAAVLGFYTLSPASVDCHRAPVVLTRNSGRYELPAFRRGRLAVDRAYQGQGLGGMLLAAARRCIRAATEVGGSAILIDARNEHVARWYESYGALPLVDAPRALLLPLEKIAQALDEQQRRSPTSRLTASGAPPCAPTRRKRPDPPTFSLWLGAQKLSAAG
jgi:GNAT superfamily N-acetyltransferase